MYSTCARASNGKQISMELLKISLEEISLSGLEGCTTEELWRYLSNRQPTIQFTLDEPTKAYIWKQLMSSIKPMVERCPICFYLLPHPRDSPSILPAFPKSLEYTHPHTYHFISDTTSDVPVRGSCLCYHERKNITMEVAKESPSLAAISEKYGNSLVLVANQELRERALLAPSCDPCLDITDIQYALLEVVGCARHYGISRPFVTSKYLKVDARSTFFYVKQLQKKGLILCKNQPSSISDPRCRMVFMLYLTKYKTLESVLPDKKQQLCSLVSQYPHKCMSLKELYANLGKKVKYVKAELVESGVLEQLQMKDVAEEFASNPDIANLQGVRLVKPYVPKEIEVGIGEDDDEDAGGGEDSSLKIPLVAELPLEMQGYRLIDSCGSTGITHEDFLSRRGLDMGRFSNRGITKNLIKKSKVVAIIQDSSAVRTISLVSAPNVGRNEDYKQLHAEAAKGGVGEEQLPILTGPDCFPPDIRERKDRRVSKTKVGLIKEETPETQPTNEVPAMMSVADSLLAELDVSVSNLNESRADRSHSKTPMSVPSSRSVSPAAIESSVKTPHNLVRTYKQLKRARVILEFFEEHRVVSNTITLAKYIRDVEHKDGHEQVLDNKTLSKMIGRLVTENKLCSKNVTFTQDDIELNSPLEGAATTQTLTLYYTPHAKEEEILAAQEAAFGAFKSFVHRKALKQKVKKDKKKKAGGDEDPDKDVLVPIPNVRGTASRFQRLRQFHCYLWILTYGHSSMDSSQIGPPKETGSDSQVLSKITFPWASAVTRLPISSRGQGWLSFFDIVNNIPLSLFLVLSKITAKIPSQYLRYFNEEQLLNSTLMDLPIELQKTLLYNKDYRRDNFHVASHLQLLEDVGVLTMEGNYNARDRTKLFVKLATKVSILDTSTCKPRRSFFLNEARSQFQEVIITLSNVADLERYWFDLQLICKQTPIILGERMNKTPGLNDSNALLYSHSVYINCKKQGNKEKEKEFNKQGFGAGGLPPMLFSHSSRNWSHQHGALSDTYSTNSHSTLSDTHPGVRLTDLPYVKMDTDDVTLSGVKRDGGEACESAPAAKRKRVSQGVRVSVPSGQVVRHEGGRGHERVRMKKVHKAVKTARKVISKQSQTQRFRVFNEISIVIEDDTIKRKGGEGEDWRTTWSTEQGNYVLSAYLACCLLHNKGAPRVTYSQIKTAMLKRFPTFKCTPTAIKRYISALLKKSPHIRSTVEIRMAECLQELSGMGRDAPEHTLDSMLEFISKRSEASKSMLSQELLLPRTLEQLYKANTIIGGAKVKKAKMLPVVCGERDINRALISDLIIATLCADESNYDQYKTFQLFESFPEPEVLAVLDKLRLVQLIKKKKQKMLGIPSKQSPLETKSYAINHNFYMKLEGHFPPNLFQDTADFLSQLDKPEGQRSSEGLPGVQWGEKCLEVHGEKAKATIAASLLGAASLSVPGSINSVLPDPLFEEVDTSDQPEEEEGLGTSAQLLREELDGASDGEDKDEDDAKDEQTLSYDVLKKLKHAHGGVSTLFGVGEGPMKHGHVEVEPTISFGELIEPTLNEQKESDGKKTRDDTTLDKHSQLTLKNYLFISEKHLEFTKTDMMFAEKLYQLIDGSGTAGVQRSTLTDHTELKYLQHNYELDYHIQLLLNFDLIFRVGVSEERLVTSTHSQRWNMSEGSHPKTLTPYRPWSAITPPHLNTSLLEKYQNGVLIHIMAHPGVTLVELNPDLHPRIHCYRDSSDNDYLHSQIDLMDYFSPTLNLNGLKDILEVLELSGQIKSHHMQADMVCTLFGSRSPQYIEYFEALA